MAALIDALDQALADFETVTLACSGGRDSATMLHALLASGRRPHVLTVDHQLRPESASAADFVVHLAAQAGLECAVLTVDVAAGQGPEDAARRARLGALVGTGRDPILLAHTADDDVETVLMRLADGAGLRGLAGIAPRRGPFLRPWLGIARDQVAAYASQHRVNWIEDPSNRWPGYRRNRVRTALTGFDEAFGPGWRQNASTAAGHLRDAQATQAFLAESWFGDGLRADGDCVWVRRERLRCAPAVQRGLVQLVIAQVERHLGALDRRARRAAVAVLAVSSGANGGADLAGGLRVERDPVGLTIWRPGVEIVPPVRSIDQPGRYDWGVWQVEVDVGAAGWVLRPRADGERYLARGVGAERSVAHGWRAAGVPRRLRAGLPILADALGALWIPGLALARRAPFERGAVRLRAGPNADVGARAWLELVET